jgi:hypothetical protein
MIACSVSRAEPEDPFAALEKETEAAIKACDGDARDAVRALIVTVWYSEELVRRLHAGVSHGYPNIGGEGFFHQLLRAG